MAFDLTILMNDSRLSVSIKSTELKYFKISDQILSFLDNIYEMSVYKDMIIITTADRDFRNWDGKPVSLLKDSREVNNIDAYDWNGNHLWNIADIVGDIKMPFYGGTLMTKKYFEQHVKKLNMDISDDTPLFIAHADPRAYIIDLTQNKVIGYLYGKR